MRSRQKWEFEVGLNRSADITQYNESERGSFFTLFRAAEGWYLELQWADNSKITYWVSQVSSSRESPENIRQLRECFLSVPHSASQRIRAGSIIKLMASFQQTTNLLSYLHGCKKKWSSSKYESQNPQDYGQHFVVANVRGKRTIANTFRGGDAGIAARRGFKRLDVGSCTVHYNLKIPCSCWCAVLAGSVLSLEFQAENILIHGVKTMGSYWWEWM